MYIHIYIHAPTYPLYPHTHKLHTNKHTFRHTPIHIYIHTYTHVHTHVHNNRPTCTHISTKVARRTHRFQHHWQKQICKHTHAWTFVCVRACLSVCACACKHIYIYINMWVWVHICAATADARTMVHRCIQYMIHPVRAHTCKHTHTRTHTHTHMHNKLLYCECLSATQEISAKYIYTLCMLARTHIHAYTTHTHTQHTLFSAPQKKLVKRTPPNYNMVYYFAPHVYGGGYT
jgi:hypothetical protein